MKVHVEFDVSDGREDQFLAALKNVTDIDQLTGCVGYRAGDEVTRRSQLIAFTEAMELKLRKNDHKDGWRTKHIDALKALMLLEVEEFKVAYEYFAVKEGRPELVDIANFALICWDRLGMLDQDAPVKPQVNDAGK